MIDFFRELNPVMQAFIGTLFTWGMTAAGAALVFFVKGTNQKFLDSMLAFAGGVMIAASYWSLLAPGIEMAEEQGVPAYIPAVVGFLLGGALLLVVDKLIPRLENKQYMYGIGSSDARKRTTLLVFSVTLHNIPEGLAIGVAFGALANGFTESALAGAVALAIGIGIQNFPEGLAVSMPLHRDGMSKKKSFFYGQFSGMVEPISAVIGALAVIFIQPILPYALSFAAGAMIFVVAKEIIPGSQEKGNVELASISLMIGFAVMMTLDVALG
ncbi:dihydroorotate dehydrogenase [Pontibacillus halophilus JSM 076056 = DSM 19796]|uniref:Dihydroorotate dehydrogenase n=1 Tax=Pontibacillus halophilus JSM 076056 = DSM 19796 TaxID=1385510 RepID=A0A0A5GHG4_9BACI|nr:ZIP family metal transporter [Pontibacillus halophilus]KGX90525.1 dihydroorotate dehydrogenase [Pontibacillus halophilus JSM 076056 = DSM 19796]